MHLAIAPRASASPSGDASNGDEDEPGSQAYIVCFSFMPMWSLANRFIQVVIVVLALLVVLGILAFYVSRLRYKYPESKFIPTEFLKSRWRPKHPRAKYGRTFRRKTHASLSDRNTSYTASVNEPDIPAESSTEMAASTDGIDRNTSVRSIMTLPAYRPSPLPSERLIAREGERAGVDTVIEFPETVDEEEARREEDMESLYQIRQARRRENNEREERRIERAAAREAGDWARVEQLRLQSQARARARARSGSVASSTMSTGEPGSSTLIAEHNLRAASRDRRVSSVSYASLGLARHDGSRIRADSVESDHRPLLDSAASMGGSNRSAASSRRGSALFQTQNFPPLPTHHRAPSADSALSLSSEAQDTPQTSTLGERSGSDPPLRTPSSDDPTSPPLERQLPPTVEPPRYDEHTQHQVGEEAPPYVSPVVERGNGPQLPPMRSVPAIEVIGTTPANSVPATPIDGHPEMGRGRR